jgi:hypothetical protein
MASHDPGIAVVDVGFHDLVDFRGDGSSISRSRNSSPVFRMRFSAQMAARIAPTMPVNGYMPSGKEEESS